jgi:deoxyribonuclease V
VEYPESYQAAVAWQEAHRGLVRLTPLPRPPRLVGGADASYSREDALVFGAIAVYSYPELEVLEEAALAGPCPFPYIPGLLSFREAPILVEVWRRLRCRPEVLLVDGQGLAHPRGLGIASHLGLLLDTSTIGVAKSRLVGEGAEPAGHRGAAAPLWWQDQVVGWILRTRTGKKPLFVSPGHRVSLEDCRVITLGCLGPYRLPEPLRRADHLSRGLRGAQHPGLRRSEVALPEKN